MTESCQWCGNKYDVDEMYDMEDYDTIGNIVYFLVCEECYGADD